LPFVLNNINQLKKLFSKTQILVFYDNSNDNSLQILKEYNKTNENMEIIINYLERTPSRTTNIAFARNSLIQLINKKFSDYEYFIMMDSNEYSCIGNMNIDVVEDVLKREDWDAISFDREAGYYDTWALSFDPFIYSFFHFNNWRKVVDNMREQFDKILNEYKMKYPDKLIPVYSAFNGFAIYRSNKFLNCKYSSQIELQLFPIQILIAQQRLTNCKIIQHFEDDCEHRNFHLEAISKNNAKICICTKSVFSKVKHPPEFARGPC
jgi:hypothetical protein